jgi:DNA-binding LytR/AlgR family response regulator
MNCLVVDDEPLALNIIAQYIGQLPYLHLVGTCRDAASAMRILSENKVDLMFLDIEMPQLNGLDFVNLLKDPPKVIFTTAYRQYAVESYEANAVDYLVKPVSLDRFVKAVQRAKGGTAATAEVAPVLPASEAVIFVKSDKKVYRLPLSTITYIESFKDYLVVHTMTGEAIQTYQPISNMEKLLPSEQFLRIHRSYIISIAHLHSFSATWVRVGELELPIGRQFREQVQQFLMV